MLRRRSIRLRIIVLVLVPVIALIGLYAVALSLTLSNYLSLQQAANVRNAIINPVTNTQLQISTERGVALEYMAEPTHARLLSLLSRERDTDSAVSAFLSAAARTRPDASGGELAAARTWASTLATLNQLRATVVSVDFSRAQAAESYSAVIAGANALLTQSMLPVLHASALIQANDLLTMEESLQSVAEERDLFTADLINHYYLAADAKLVNELIVQRRELWNQAMSTLSPQYRKLFTGDIPATASASLASFESQIDASPRSALQVPLRAWTSANDAYATGFRQALRSTSDAIRAVGFAQARGVLLQLLLIGGLGLLAIIAAIAIAIILSRVLLQQLDDLRLSALELSTVRLPVVLTRLRSGEEVDIPAETPQLDPGPSEIGQLGRAFNLAAQTAVTAAADEAEIRRGVNDVFRNLARRNQSLLTRQLELIDAMERRVHDPEELADLFRIDHLTTRMRRHAEGLLIVAGGSSGRGWREAVPIVDVMRAAVAEVEDYTRIRVASRSSSLVAGHAVADVIHLLAELVENATTFSPAHTPVRIESDNVAKGLIVEIEDRGLGMSDEQIQEVNTKLTDPPLLDLSGSEQLGLFIAGQLARRHEVRITMRASAYGGIIAVVLIPRSLVIDPGYDEPLTIVGLRELGGRPVPQLPAAAAPADEDTAVTVSATAEPGYAGTSSYLVDLETAATSITTTAAHIGTGPRDQAHAPEFPADLASAALVPPAGPLPSRPNPAGTLPSRPNPAGTLPSRPNPAGTLPSRPNPPGTLPSRHPACTLPSRHPAGTLPSRHPAGTLPSRPDPAGTLPSRPDPADEAVIAEAGADAGAEGGLKGAGSWLFEAGSANRATSTHDPAGDSLPGAASVAPGGTGSPMLILGPTAESPGQPNAAAAQAVSTGEPTADVSIPADANDEPMTSALLGPSADVGRGDRAVGWPEIVSDSPVGGPVGWPDHAAMSAGWLNLASRAASVSADHSGDADYSGDAVGQGRRGPSPRHANGAPDEPIATGTIPLLPRRQARTHSASLRGGDPAQASRGGYDTRPEPSDTTDSFPALAARQPAAADLDGLPVRVRQASLAPQLREQMAPARAAQQYIAAPQSSPDQAEPMPGPSPEAARSFMSALQRGWERGRSMAEEMTDEPNGKQP